jgi:hypothetical protein
MQPTKLPAPRAKMPAKSTAKNLAQIQEIIADYTGHLPNEVADTDAAQALYEGTFQAAQSLIQTRQKPAANEYGRRTENGQMIYWNE